MQAKGPVGLNPLCAQNGLKYLGSSGFQGRAYDLPVVFPFLESLGLGPASAHDLTFLFGPDSL